MANERRGAVLAQELGNGAAEAADNAVLLGGDDAARLERGLPDQLAVERLDGVHVDDADGDALRSHHLAGLQRHLDHEARGDDGDVLAVLQRDALVQLKLVALDLVRDGLNGSAAQAQVSRAVILEQRLDGELHLVAVAGAQDLHAGDDAHQGQILGALVGRAVFADGQTAV